MRERADDDTVLYADPAEVARLREVLLASQVDLLLDRSPFYGRTLTAAGVRTGSVRTLEDLATLPVTRKSDFLDAPEDFRLLLPDGVPLEESTLAYLIYTTGTTSGAPAPLYVTTSDDWDYLLHARRCARMLGLTADDVIANLFPLTAFPMGARIRADRTAAAVGASIFQGHTGAADPGWPVHRRMDEALDLVVRHRATVLWGVAGFVRRLLVRAAERELRLPHVRWCFVTGEASSAAALDSMRHWLAQVGAPGAEIADRYGSTEGWSMIRCPGGEGWHNPSPEAIHLEVVDADSGRPVPDGEAGQLLITQLRSRGTAFLRYAVGDVVRLSREPCGACGRTSERLVSQPRRVRDLVKVNGTLVNLGVLGDALTEVAGVSEHRIVLDHVVPGDALSGDAIVVEVAVAGRAAGEVLTDVRERIRSLVHVTPRVSSVPADEIFDPASHAKPQRLLDRRAHPSTEGVS